MLTNVTCYAVLLSLIEQIQHFQHVIIQIERNCEIVN